MSVNICPDNILLTTIILLPNMVWWCCRMSQSVTRNKICLLSSRSRSQRELTLWKYYSDYYIFWTVIFFGNQTWSDDRLLQARASCGKIGLLHSRSRLQRRVKMSIFIQIFSKPLNILLPNSVLWCIIMSWSVVQNDLFAIFKVKVTARACMIKIWEFCTVSSKLLILLLQNFVW